MEGVSAGEEGGPPLKETLITGKKDGSQERTRGSPDEGCGKKERGG